MMPLIKAQHLHFDMDLLCPTNHHVAMQHFDILILTE